MNDERKRWVWRVFWVRGFFRSVREVLVVVVAAIVVVRCLCMVPSIRVVPERDRCKEMREESVLR